MWAINDPSKKTIRTKLYRLIKANHIVNELENCKETFAGITLAELMKDQLVKDECPVIGGVKNKLGERRAHLVYRFAQPLVVEGLASSHHPF